LSNNVRHDTYRPRHASGCKRPACSFKGPDVKILESMVSCGKLPLIRLYRREATENVQIEIVEHTRKRPFIAMSHVWAGGLGNFNSNTIPQCQINFLYENARKLLWRKLCKRFLRNWRQRIADISESVRNNDPIDELLLEVFMSPNKPTKPHTYRAQPLTSPPNQEYYLAKRWRRVMDLTVSSIGDQIEDYTAGIHIWIDTLCIPSDPKIKHKAELQQKSIDKMPLIYAMAKHVLVIDQVAMKLSIKEPELSLAAQLATSPWMTRSWTFQEGCLAEKISFLLTDEDVTPSEILSNAKCLKQKTPELGRHWEAALMKECMQSFERMKEISQLSQLGGIVNTMSTRYFSHVWNELAVRQTSKPVDLHGLLAVLMGLSVREVFIDESGNKRSPSERMLAILRAQPFLPLSMLSIQHQATTLMCEGVAWVPQYPSGYLSHCEEKLIWRKESSMLQLPACSEAVSYLIPSSDGKTLFLGGKCIFSFIESDIKDQSKKIRRSIAIEIRPRTTQLTAHRLEVKAVFILDRSSGSGALCIMENSHDGAGPTRLGLICPIKYEFVAEESGNGAGSYLMQMIADTKHDILLNIRLYPGSSF